MKRPIRIIFLFLSLSLFFGSCAPHKRFHLDKKEVATSSVQVHRNKDGVYYIHNDLGWYIWMMNSGSNNGSNYSYSSAYRSDTSPDFSQGQFVPMSDVKDATVEFSPATDVTVSPDEANVTIEEVSDSMGNYISDESFSSSNDSSSFSDSVSTDVDSGSSFDGGGDFGGGDAGGGGDGGGGGD